MKNSSRYSRVNCRVWNDSKVRRLSIAGKLLWFRLLAPLERGRIPGLFQAWPEALKKSTGLQDKQFDKAWGELIDLMGIEYDAEWGLIYLAKAVKHDPPRNPNTVKSWVIGLNELPECELKSEAIRNIKQFCQQLGEHFAKPLDGLLPEYDHDHNHYHDHDHKKDRETVSRETKESNLKRAKLTAESVGRVWDHYADKYDKEVNKKRRLTSGMKKKIETRLKEFTAEELMSGIDRLFVDPWYREKGLFELKFVVKSDTAAEEWINKSEAKTDAKPNARVVQIGGARSGDADIMRRQLGMKGTANE